MEPLYELETDRSPLIRSKLVALGIESSANKVGVGIICYTPGRGHDGSDYSNSSTTIG